MPKKVFTMAYVYSLERELSHILSDMGSYNLPKKTIVERLMSVRKGIRDTMRKAGYKGLF